MSEAEEKRGFKVEDRRRFSSDGEARSDAQDSDDQDRPSPPPSAETGAGARVSPAQEPSATAPSAGAQEPAGAELTFGGFVVSLSTQALMHLGEIADPQSGQPTRDLGAAREMIDILGMLHEKTRGNLDSGEQALLETVLFDLRMKYVELARQS